MIQSMTGYGKASGKVKGAVVQVEIRSLNSKALELGLRLPQAYRAREAVLRQLLTEKIQRGKTDVIISCDVAVAGTNHFNGKAIRSYVKELQLLARDLKLPNERFLQLVLSLPNSVQEEKTVLSEAQWRQVLALVHRALRDFFGFRLKEGKAIEKDLVGRLKTIQSLLRQLEQQEPARLVATRTRLLKLFDQAQGMEVDKNRFEQELIFYLERMDVTEEKIRLQSHCSYFMETLRSVQQNGKKLGFISQEMGREINTLGAKVNDAGMQRLVVMMKDELEKMKEQLANVL